MFFKYFHISLHVVVGHLFSLPYHVALCEWTTICLSILLLMGILVVSSLGVFSKELLFLYMLLFAVYTRKIQR